MKKFIVSTAVLFATIIGSGSAMAQNPAVCKAECPKSEQCAPGKCDTAKCCKGGVKGQLDPFAGLNLSDKQKSELAALKKECRLERDKKKSSDKNLRNERRQCRQEARKEQLSKIKAILTPEQYHQFLENSYIQQSGNRHGARMAKGKKMKHAAKAQKIERQVNSDTKK